MTGTVRRARQTPESDDMRVSTCDAVSIAIRPYSAICASAQWDGGHLVQGRLRCVAAQPCTARRADRKRFADV